LGTLQAAMLTAARPGLLLATPVGSSVRVPPGGGKNGFDYPPIVS